MSRIGKLPIQIPEGVTIECGKDNVVTVKGKKGELKQELKYGITIQIDNDKKEAVVARPSDGRQHKAMHGLYRSLVANMIEGVSTAFTKQLEIIGVGYKAVAQGQVLELGLGFSHAVFFVVPDEIKVSAQQEKGKSPIVTLEGCDKQLLGYVAAKIKSLYKVEPYKGKGIRFVGEVVRRKAGKMAAK